MRPLHTIIALAMAAAPLWGETTAPAIDSSKQAFKDLPTLTARRFDSSLTAGYRSCYWGRGLVATQSAEQGEGVEPMAFKTTYDFGDKGGWSFSSAVAYTILSAGHTLYGNPPFSHDGARYALQQRVPGFDQLPPEVQEQYIGSLEGKSIKHCNMENEFAVVTSLNYKHEKWNVSFGHDFIHGGILGVMAKHYRGRATSKVNETFVNLEITPYKWLGIGCNTHYSFSGVNGWWFEPFVNFRAPIIGSADDVENIKMLAMVQFGMSVTADYFESHYFACNNGSQGYWIKISTPYFITRNWILTPALTIDWAGRGAMKANTKSEMKKYSGDGSDVPFREFALVSEVSLTYKF